MDVSARDPTTPRRSARIKTREPTAEELPQHENKTPGPRAMAKLKKAQRELNKTTAFESETNAKVILPRTSLPDSKNEEKKHEKKDKKKAEKESTTPKATLNPETDGESTQSSGEGKKNTSKRRGRRGKKNNSVDESQPSQATIEGSSGSDDTTVIENKTIGEEATVTIPEKIVEENMEEPQETSEVVAEPEKMEVVEVPEKMEVVEVPETPAGENLTSEVVATPAGPIQTTSDETKDVKPVIVIDLNTTPNLMDESSIISVLDSPQREPQPRKDSTFSPVVDTSITDSRPNIDLLNLTPTAPLPKLPHRTSTPLVQKLLKSGTPRRVNTPKLSVPVISKLAKILTPKKNDEEEEPMKLVNPLEKSILKSSRRKRSLSVADAESFAQKRVMFISPQVMDIGTIDEKMMASFIEEKENSIMKQAASSVRRKRSMSISTPGKERPPRTKKMPDFKAIHQQQFEKMESIADHALRKAERAKKLATPPQARSNVEVKRPVHQAASKIPTVNNRKPLVKPPSVENLVSAGSRVLKRSQSAPDEEPVVKKVLKTNEAGSSGGAKKIAVVTGLQRTKSENPGWKPATISFVPSVVKKPVATTTSVAQANRTKIEERRERNMGMYKTTQVQRSATDRTQKNASVLKGVRLNRRFELQMKHRRDHEDHECEK